MTRTPRTDSVVDHLPLLRRYARSLTRDGERADELVQDTLVRAFERRHTFRGGSELRSWLLAIMHNIFISRMRREAVERSYAAQSAGTQERLSEPGQEHALLLAEVHEAFAALPDEQRAALYLVAVEGLSYEEAAAALVVPIGTLMSRVSRARAALRTIQNAGSAEEGPAARRAALRIIGGPDDVRK